MVACEEPICCLNEISVYNIKASCRRSSQIFVKSVKVITESSGTKTTPTGYLNL